MIEFLSRSSVIFALALAACGGNSQTFQDPNGPGGVGPGGLVVGATCAKDTDCRFKCENNTCTAPCASDRDCPLGTVCIDDHGGVCLVSCTTNANCAGIGSPSYVCKDEDRLGSSGQARVCRKP